MNEKDNFALVPKPPSSLLKSEPGTRRILSGMVADTLAVATKETCKPAKARFRIGNYEWCEPDYRQILVWAKALALDPEEFVKRLQTPGFLERWNRSGRIVEAVWDRTTLPLPETFEWVEGLVITHLEFWGHPRQKPALRALAPSLHHLTHMSCADLGLELLDLSGVPSLSFLFCPGNKLSRLDLSLAPNLRTLLCNQNRLEELDLTITANLTRLDCQLNGLKKLVLPRMPMLDKLFCWDNRLSNLDLSGLPNLTALWCAGNGITELDLSQLQRLEDLDCRSNPITTLDVRPLRALKDLEFDRDKTRLLQRPDQHF